MVRSYGLPGWADSPQKPLQPPGQSRATTHSPPGSTHLNGEKASGFRWRQRSTAGRPGLTRPIRGCCRRTSSPWRGSPTPAQARSEGPHVCARRSKPSGLPLLWTPLSCPCTPPSWAAPRLSGLGRCWPCCCWRWRPSWLSPQNVPALVQFGGFRLDSTQYARETTNHKQRMCPNLQTRRKSRFLWFLWLWVKGSRPDGCLQGG